MGLRGRGRIRDYHYILSELRNRATYRHQVTSQRRRAHLVLDIRDMADGGPARRLIDAAIAVGGILLGMPETVVTVGFFGADRPIPTTAFVGIGDWFSLRRTVEAARKFRVNPWAGPGLLRQVCTTEDPAHAVLVTCYMTPSWLLTLRLEQGGTLIAVEPPAGDAVGMHDGLLVSQPVDALSIRMGYLDCIPSLHPNPKARP